MMLPSVFILKRFIVLVAMGWVLLLVVMHQRLLTQHRENEKSAAQILTGNMLKIRCGDEISVLKDRFCIKRFKWVIMNWIKDGCFGELGVTSESDIDCSVYQYLVFVERACQVPSNAPELFSYVILSPQAIKNSIPQTEPVKDFDLLLDKLAECGKVCQWIGSRVKSMRNNWLKTQENLLKKQSVEYNFTSLYDQRESNSTPPEPRLRILLHMGLLTKEYGLNFGVAALAGGPLGELVQWADLMSALHVMGHYVVLSWSPERLREILTPNRRRGQTCQPGRTVDLLFTDIIGLEQIRETMGSLYHYRCLLRVLDVYGTDPEFNHPQFNPDKDKSRSWGGKGLDPSQFFTHFPHSADNSFLGFVVEGRNMKADETKSRNSALLYGKRTSLIAGKTKQKYLDKIHEIYSDIHATMWSKDDVTDEFEVPAYVSNHRHLEQQDFLDLLRKSSIFVGLGWPIEGPAALEAIANGVVFLNPRFAPARFVDIQKPNNRKVTSQNPYVENIGKPHVYTVNMKDLSQVEEALREIKQNERPKAFVPHEFSYGGYLERLQAYVKNQDFCDEPVRKLVSSNLLWKHVKRKWPPKSTLQLKTSMTSESCSSTCTRQQLMCERSFFSNINNKESFHTVRQHCLNHRSIDPRFEYREFLDTKGEYEQFQVPCHAPSYTTSSEYCYTQQDPLLFSCACTPPDGVVRLCPCRRP